MIAPKRILMVASEATPFAKTGGLADVVGSLPTALTHFGHEVAVVMPRYRAIDWNSTESAFDNMTVWLGARSYTVSIRKRLHNGITFFFVEHNELYDRDGIYASAGRDFGDNHIRYAVLSLAALGIHQTLFPAGILHIHDWQAALLPVYFYQQQHDNPAFYGVRIVLTIHNLGYQGRFHKSLLPALGLDWGWFSRDRLEYYDDINLLKGGIILSGAINTVSPTYAREIQTPEGGFGLDGVLRGRSDAVSGILNGVDYSEWSPQTDRFIAAHYSAENLEGKRACKRALLAEFGLPLDDLNRPLIGIVSRFADQKGFDLVAAAAHEFYYRDVQLVVLGSGDGRYEQLFRDWSTWMPGKVGVHIGYNNRLAHLIEAGADMFLMPSRYEPCGLNQMYSLHYGTVPIVRATGGLNDTVRPETGFKFTPYTADALIGALEDALTAYGNPDAWGSLVRTGMAEDFSWDASARQYSQLYQQLGA